MAQLVRISCINKTNRLDPHERIQSVGGINPDGTRWKLPLDRAIAGIEDGSWDFWVERPPGNRVAVVRAIHLGHKYLRTTSDGVQPDNLLALPECP